MNLTDNFLVAMPNMADDPLFGRSVIYLCEHTEHGALGLIINRPLDVALGDLLDHLELPAAGPHISALPVFLGGPVSTERGFVLHEAGPAFQATMEVSATCALSTSPDALAAIAAGQMPVRFLVTLGFCSWSAGQLEHEIAENSWLSVPADPDILFTLPPDDRRPAALKLLGIDFAMLNEEAGHA